MGLNLTGLLLLEARDKLYKFAIDHVNSVYNKCDHVHSLGILAGKILLHWFYGKVDILCHNFHIKPRVMKVKAGQVLRCALFHHIKS